MKNTINTWASNLRKPIVTPIGVYLLSFILPALIILLPLIIFNWSNDYMMAHTYVIGTLGQLLMDIPAVFMFYYLQTLHDKHMGNNLRNEIFIEILGFILA